MSGSVLSALKDRVRERIDAGDRGDPPQVPPYPSPSSTGYEQRLRELGAAGTARSASRATTAFTFLGDVTPKAVDATCLATEQQLRAQAVAAAKTGRATPTSVDDTADGAILPATSRPVAGSTVDGQPRFVLAGKVPAGTVAVIGTDADGTAITATLEPSPTGDVAFALQVSGDAIYDCTTSSATAQRAHP